jgi:cytochrome P450
MDKIARSHFEQTWESKGEIIAVKVIKQFAFSLVANLFLSVTKGPEFESMAHDVEAFVGGIMKLPIDFPGTAYHKAMLARKSLLRTFDIIIARRQKDIEEGKVSVHHDLLSILMKTLDHESHVITNETIKDNMLTYWIASHDTVSTTLSLVLKYLFLNPHCLHEVVKGKTHDQTMFTPINFTPLFVFIFENFLKKNSPKNLVMLYSIFQKTLHVWIS